jgi:hypothetical protein
MYNTNPDLVNARSHPLKTPRREPCEKAAPCSDRIRMACASAFLPIKKAAHSGGLL